MYGLEFVPPRPTTSSAGPSTSPSDAMADKGYVESRQVPGAEGTGGLPRRLFRAGSGITAIY
jgi:hypothetical protein